MLALIALLSQIPVPQAGELREGMVEPAESFAHVEARTGDTVVGTGNAVAITADHFATACHVVVGADQLRLIQSTLSEGSVLAAQVPQTDICFLTRPSAFKAKPIQRQETAPQPGDPLTLIGVRQAGPGYQLSIGTIMAQPVVAGVPLFLTDAPVPPGMSGSGAFDRDGKLVGFAVGRWRRPALGVVVTARALAKVQPARPADTVALSPLPPYLDERQVWPDMLRLGLGLQLAAKAAQSRIDEGWSFSWDNARCATGYTDPLQAQFGLTLAVEQRDEAVIASLVIERHEVSFAQATKPLTVILYPSGKVFRLRPARLVQPPDHVLGNRWNVRWNLDDAGAFLAALPGSTALVASSRGQDLGALSINPDRLWHGLRETCL